MGYLELDMKNRICMITGATAGIGLETARALASKGAHLILVGRNAEKGKEIKEQIIKETQNQNIEFFQADLSSQKSILSFAEAFYCKYQRLDILVNNAGAVISTRQASVDDIEMTFALNHLNYFMLSLLLLNALKASDGARIINVASRAHFNGRIDLSDLESNKRYSGFNVYSNSKLANVLFTYELADRLKGTGITVNALHPGVVASNFGSGNAGMYKLIKPIFRLVGITPKEGAQTSIYLATSREVEGITGEYFTKMKTVPSSKISYDKSLQKDLWNRSLQYTGLSDI